VLVHAIVHLLLPLLHSLTLLLHLLVSQAVTQCAGQVESTFAAGKPNQKSLAYMFPQHVIDSYIYVYAVILGWVHHHMTARYDNLGMLVC
jgi:hypothetical protein